MFEEAFRDYMAGDGTGIVIVVNSGTDALKLSLLAAGVQHGDEGVTVANTAIPTATAICSVGAGPKRTTVSGDVEWSREELIGLLRDVKAKGKRVTGYGETSKSTTVTNYCGITPDLVEFISDTTPIKQGKYSPGAYIPVRPYEEFLARRPDYALLFTWNHAREILAKERNFLDSGGRFIAYVPEVGILSRELP